MITLINRLTICDHTLSNSFTLYKLYTLAQSLHSLQYLCQPVLAYLLLLLKIYAINLILTEGGLGPRGSRGLFVYPNVHTPGYFSKVCFADQFYTIYS